MGLFRYPESPNRVSGTNRQHGILVRSLSRWHRRATCGAWKNRNRKAFPSGYSYDSAFIRWFRVSEYIEEKKPLSPSTHPHRRVRNATNMGDGYSMEIRVGTVEHSGGMILVDWESWPFFTVLNGQTG